MYTNIRFIFSHIDKSPLSDSFFASFNFFPLQFPFLVTTYIYLPIQKYLHRTYKGILWNWKMSTMTRRYLCVLFLSIIFECCGFWNNIEPSSRKIKNIPQTEWWLLYSYTVQNTYTTISIYTHMLKTFVKNNLRSMGHFNASLPWRGWQNRNGIVNRYLWKI